MKKKHKKNKNFYILKFLLTVFIVANIFEAAFSENFSDLSYAQNSILLDSSQIVYPEFKMDFPNPSEYKKIYKKHNSTFEPEENNLQTEVNAVEPLPELPNIINSDNNKEIKPYNPIIDSSQILQKTNDEEINSIKKFLPFKNADTFTPPSEYNAKNNISSPVPQELIPEFTYHAKANIDNENDFEGKLISNIQITGIDKIKPQILLNTIQTGCGTKFNSETLQQDLQNIYALGYFTENMSVDPILKNDGTVELTFSVEENVIIKDIQIKGNTIYQTSELMNYLKPLKNMPQNINQINECTAKIKEHYENDGYILAHISSIDDNSDGTLFVTISEGKIAEIKFDEDKKTKDFVIKRNMLTQAGNIYNEEVIKKDLSRIYATQIFDDVERIIEPSSNSDEYIVRIKVKESSSNSVSIGGGVDSGLGIFGSIGVNEKNFLGRGQYIGLSGMIGSGILLNDASIKHRVNYQLELNFKEPHFINADNSLLSKLYYRDLGSYQIPLAVERRFGLKTNIVHKVKNKDYLTTGLGVGFEHIHLSEGDYNKIASIYSLRNISISKRAKQLTGGSFLNITPSVTYNTLDDNIMPRSGTYAQASFNEAFSISNAKNTNGRLIGKVTKYFPVFKKSTLSLTAKGGIKVHGDKMPEIMAFSLGGPYSVRGFRMSGVGTGEAFAAASAELLTPIPFFERFKYDILKNMRFAFFVDAGKVFDPTVTSKLYDRPLHAISAGIGIRVYIPGMGPIAVDYALPFTHVGQYNSKHGYFTFGTPGLYDNY